MRKYAVIGLSILITAAFWANSFWNRQDVSYNTDTIVMMIGDQKVNVSEVMIHFLLCREEVENRWGTSMWSAQIGSDDNGQPITYEDDIKSDIAEEIKAEKSLKQEAEDHKIKLTKKEKSDCKSRAEEVIKEFSNDEILRYGITIDKLTSHFEDEELAMKFCSESMEEIESEYDQEDFVMTTVHAILFSTVEQDQTEMIEQEKATVRENAEKALIEIQSGKSLDDIAMEYDLNYNKKETFRLSDEENESSQWYQLEELEDGEVSGLIEMKYGYLIVQMICKNDEEKSLAEWKQVINKAKDDKIIQIYENQYADNYRIRVEEEIWEALPLASSHE